MFGWFKKKSDPVEPSVSAIVPRIKHRNFVRALDEMGIPSDDQPITQPLVGELLVTYAFDLGNAFAMVTPSSLADLGIASEDLLGISSENVAQQVPNITTRKKGPLLQIVTGGNLEACTLLNGGFWDGLAEQVSGPLVVAVPHRDIVVTCSGDDNDALLHIRTIADVATQGEDNHALTDQLLEWADGKWQLYVRNLTGPQKLEFVRKFTNTGLSAANEALKVAGGNRLEAVKQLSPTPM